MNLHCRETLCFLKEKSVADTRCGIDSCLMPIRYQRNRADPEVDSFPDHPTETRLQTEGVFFVVVQINATQIRSARIKRGWVFSFTDWQKPTCQADFHKLGGDARCQRGDVIPTVDGHVFVPVFQSDGWVAEAIHTDFIF